MSRWKKAFSVRRWKRALEAFRWKKSPLDPNWRQRRLLEETIIPGLNATGDVLFVGVRNYCRYDHLFTKARRYDTFDIDPSVEPTVVGDICRATNVADESYDWVIFVGMYEIVDNPFDAVNELYRILRFGGFLLFGGPFRMHWSPLDTKDKWRVTKHGIYAHLRRFQVERIWDVGEVYSFFLCQKPQNPS